MSKYFAAVSLGALVVALSVASCKCNKEEEIPPMPSAPAVNSTPPPPVELVVEDAGPDAEDADADAKKATGPYNPTGLMACCNALAQNAKSAPPTQAPFMLQAAAACKAAAASGNTAGVNAALRSGGMAGCK
jgi:hypothetical protein